MNCRNCGMPLTGTKCEYCDTDYSAELRRFFITTRRPLEVDTTPALLFADDRIIAMKMGDVIWDEDGLPTKPLSDTTLTTSSAWRWNL